ncbi:MAG: hypothetical protein UW95_C0023G0024 [Parcubacteria group bacterium GW2011_GWC1_45_14]|nr:MAG: hypothetical protein UW87_C0037G0002 [Candidatus Moranbacteria bacterium GW2011_GWC2_45_10]KKT93428.1 MAG: hypothetical protein UW95_C0023G0024 [Parcubacteria group bacterium GW2011_GWC1_45_14]
MRAVNDPACFLSMDRAFGYWEIRQTYAKIFTYVIFDAESFKFSKKCRKK